MTIQLNNAQLDVQCESMTARKLANMANQGASFDAIVARLSVTAFAGKRQTVDKAHILYQTMIELVKDREAFKAKAGDGDKFQALSIFQKAIGRYVASAAHIKDKRVSIKTTGPQDKWSIALVSVTADNKGKGKAEPKGKNAGGKGNALKAFANLAECLDAVIDAYGLDAVKAELAKRS